MVFGENGAVLTNLSDEQLLEETSNRDYQIHAIVVVGFLIAMIQIAWVVQMQKAGSSGIWWTISASSVVLSIVPGLVGFARRAKADKKLTRITGLARQQQPLSPLLVALILALGISLWRGTAFLMAHQGSNRIVISDVAGLFVVCIIGLAFCAMILGPRFVRLWARPVTTFLSRILAPVRGALIKLGTGIAVFDAWLVHILAPLSGITAQHSVLRYFIPAAQLLPCAYFAFYMPPAPALVAIAWAFLISISIARRWAWTESDRERALRDPDYKDEQLKVGVVEDLRDEALLALLFLIALLPFAMRQVHIASGGHVFGGIDADVLNDPLKWIGFFGVELAKAIPFVDWAEIFGVDGNATIKYAGRPAASLVVFIARAIVDFVFLAALLEAISVAMRWARHKQSFLEQEIDRLDTMIEKEEFGRLARHQSDGNWTFLDEITQFLHYNETSLRRIRISFDQSDPQWQTANEIMRINKIDPGTPAEQFLALALAKQPDQLAILSAWEAAQSSSELGIEDFEAARIALNHKAPFNELRAKMVARIIELPRSDERTTVLRYVLVEKDADSIAPIRTMVVAPLAESVPTDERAQTALTNAAESDPAKSVRLAASDALANLKDPVLI